MLARKLSFLLRLAPPPALQPLRMAPISNARPPLPPDSVGLSDAFDPGAKDMKDPAWPSRPFVTYNIRRTPFE